MSERLMIEPEGRYDRQTLITWWDQERLANARVLVIGAGALGNELVKNLTLIGVGTTVVVDMDAVENTNLSRCVLFREGDESKSKAVVVAERATELNPEVRVIPLAADARLAVGPGLVDCFDVVLGGLDNREARLHINQACWKAGVPWIDGAIEGLMGVMRVFCPPDSACYECTMNEADHKLLAARKSCALLSRGEMLEGKVPTTATSASVIAALQAQEAVKLLHHDSLHSDFAGQGFVFNGLTHDSYVVNYKRRDDCLSHDHYDLAGMNIERDKPLADCLHQAQGSLGPDTVLELEHELVRSMTCGRCGEGETVNRPIETFVAGDALCPRCEGERRLDMTHSIGTGDELLLLSAEDIGLWPFDIVTARSGTGRKHYILDGQLDPFVHLEATSA